jgi:hypothetical protein
MNSPTASGIHLQRERLGRETEATVELVRQRAEMPVGI